MNTLGTYLKRKASTITKFVSNSPSDLNEPGPHLPASSNSPEQEEPSKPTLFDVYNSVTRIDSQGSSNTTVPQSILAFRTITTLLGSLRKAGDMNITPSNHSPDPNVRQELRILVALATVLVRNHEVVSVVALHSERPQQGDNLQPIACTHSTSADDNKEQPIPSQMGGVESTLKLIWKLCATANYRRDADKSNGSLGGGGRNTLKNQDTPMVSMDEAELRESYVTPNARTKTFDEHVMIISQLIRHSKMHPNEGIGVFQDYVLTACISKIVRRLKDRKLSKPFFDSLIAVSSFKFTSTDVEGSDQDLYLKLCDAGEVLELPHLLERCKAITAGAPCQLYTEDTCSDFHRLLCRLLQSFREKMEMLDSSWDSGTLALAAGYGNMLWSLSRSRAIESHLKTIQSQLLPRKAADGRKGDENGGGRKPDIEHQAVQASARQEAILPQLLLMKAADDGKGDEIDDEQEPDIEHQAVQTDARQDSQRVPLWQSYRDWLRLMVAHLDAVAILHRYASGRLFRYDGVSITVIPPPPVTTALLPWEELLRSEHFPQIGVDSASSNEDLVTFLNESMRKADMMKFALKSLKTLRTAGQKTRNSHSNSIVRALRAFESDTSVAEIISKLVSLAQSTDISDVRWCKEVSEVIDMAIALSSDGVFFDELKKTENGNSFGGLEHCEALLSGLITLLRTPESALSRSNDAGHVIGVSKPCCPVCHYLLPKLSKYPVSGQFKPFVTRGAHNAISACSLPYWLPEEIIREMNLMFGTQLRQQLVQYMTDFKSMRHRADSTTSARLSIDSLEDSRHMGRNDMAKFLDVLRKDVQ